MFNCTEIFKCKQLGGQDGNVKYADIIHLHFVKEEKFPPSVQLCRFITLQIHSLRNRFD